MSGTENMGLDEALMDRARQSGECVIRIYGWAKPTLSLGRNQAAVGEYDVARAHSLGVDIVRRPTGGRAVLHCREITYSVTAPTDALGDLRQCYGKINRILISALERIGVSAQLAAPVERTPAPTAMPCFDAPAADEILAGGRKLVGSAQVREKLALLQHGSILIDDDQRLANELMLRPGGTASRPATLRALLGYAPAAVDVAEALLAALRAETGCAAQPLELDAPLIRSAEASRRKYESRDWTWRR